MNELLKKNWAVLVTSVLMVLLVGAFAVWKFFPGLITKKESPFRIDEDLLVQDQASTKKSTATSTDPIHAKVNCDKNKNLNLSLKNEQEVVDQKNVQCKQEDTEVTFDSNQIKPGENYQINVEDSTFTEGQNNAQANGDQQAAQDQAADLVGDQQSIGEQQTTDSQQTGNQSPTGDQQQVDASEQSPALSSQEKPGSDSPNQNGTIVANGDTTPNFSTFGWGFDAGIQSGNSKPDKPNKPNKPNKPSQPNNPGKEESSESSSEQESSSDEPASNSSTTTETPRPSTSNSSSHSSNLVDGITNIVKPKPTPKPDPKPQTKPQASKESKPDVTVNQNQSAKEKKEKNPLEVHISAFQGQKQKSVSQASPSQNAIQQQQPSTNENQQQQSSTTQNDHQNQQPVQEKESEAKPEPQPEEKPAPKQPKKMSLDFPGAEKFSKNASGPEIETLITLLNKSGYQTQEKHRFTSEVSKEVQKFQQDQGWTGKDADGVPGPETWKRLVNNYKGGFPGAQYFTKKTKNNGYFVKILEKKLKEKGLISKVTQSGEYTETMKKAVQKFQQSQGWTGKDADGIPGQETWARLMK